MKKRIMGLLGLAVTVAGSAWGASVEITTVPVSSDSILGIRRTVCGEDTPKEIAIGVPWLDFDKESITIADVVTTGVKAGDKIKAYDQDKKIYWVWQWMAVTGYEGWVPTKDTKEGFAPDPTVFQVKRGTGLWLTRGAPTNTIVQAGLYTTIPVTNQVKNVNDKGQAATVKAPVHTLLFSPVDRAFRLTDLTEGCAHNDRVYIPTTGVSYTFVRTKSVAAWGTYETDDWGFPAWKKADKIDIPSNTAFWYISAGGNPKIVW